MTSRDPNSAFVTRTRSPDTWIGERNTNASMQMLSHVGGGRDNEFAFACFIVRVAAADEVLEPH